MILIAPTSYKGTIGARAAALAMADGAVRAGYPDLDVCPVADGGPGLVDALLAPGSRVERVHVRGPLGDPVVARVLIDRDEAIIESADACGLHLLDRPAPMRANTFGVGELLRAAASYADTVVVGLGGSGTVDGGVGAAAAASWRFLNAAGRPLEPVPASLGQLDRIELPEQLPQARFLAVADVETKLFGAHGAARVFGPQKGATPTEVELLDAGLERLARIIRRDAGTNVGDLVGGGAAGGLGAGLHAFFGAELRSGSAWVFERLHLSERIHRADLVITGEGSYDDQSGLGKITGSVIAAARAANTPVLLIAGRVDTDLPSGVHAVSGSGVLTTVDLAGIVERTLPRLLPR